MMSLATKSPSNDTSMKSAGVTHSQNPAPKSAPFFTGINTFIQTKSFCPCDGGCPRCGGVIQPKLTIGQPNDKYEQEADSIADRVMRMPEPEGSLVNGHSSFKRGSAALVQTKPIAEQISPIVQRKCSSCGNLDELVSVQAKPASNQVPAVSSYIEAGVHSLKGGGQPLPETTRSYFEPRFGADFSQVRVHTGARATEVARLLNARAFTIGREMVFGSGQYSPGTAAGKSLLGHELTHVVQQFGGRASQMIQRQIDNTEPPASVINDRIDVRAQFAFLRLFKSDSPEDRSDAIELFYKVDSGEIKGIYGDDLGIAAQLAKKRNKVRWELHEIGEPKGGDAVWIEDDAPDAEIDTPVIIFRESAGKKPRLDNALLMVYRYHEKKGVIPPGVLPECPAIEPDTSYSPSSSIIARMVRYFGPNQAPGIGADPCQQNNCPCGCPLPRPSGVNASIGDICKVKKNATSVGNDKKLFCPPVGSQVKVIEKNPPGFLGVGLCQYGNKFIYIQENFVEDCSPLSIEHKTRFSVQGFSDTTRTNIGVGEEVYLEAACSVTWTTTAGDLSPNTGLKVKLTAPDTAQTVTVTAGSATKTFTVFSPTDVHMDPFLDLGVEHKKGRPDSGINTFPFLLPDNVNFYNVIYQELEVGAVVTPPNAVYSCHSGGGHCMKSVGQGCGDLRLTTTVEPRKGTKAVVCDRVYSGDCPDKEQPFNPGSITSSIPYEYKVGKGSFHRFNTVNQVSALAADANTLTSEKLGAKGETTVNSDTVPKPLCPINIPVIIVI